MFKKSMVIKTAVVVFCAGVLLGGIGTGVAIAEYTSLEYTGEHILGAENMKTENLDVSVVPEAGKKIKIPRHYQVDRVHYGEDIPENTVRYVVTYNTELVKVWTEYEEFEQHVQDGENTEDRDSQDRGQDDADRYQGCVWLNYNYVSDEFDLFMRNKDKILEELKRGQFGSYRMESIQSIEIWMNPRMKEFVEHS